MITISMTEQITGTIMIMKRMIMKMILVIKTILTMIMTRIIGDNDDNKSTTMHGGTIGLWGIK